MAEAQGTSPVLAVGFADMVGFTMLSQHLGDDELAAVVSRFEALAHDTVVALGGRVVKMIGDEVMFVVPTATGAASIGLSLAEAYAGDELLSDVRVALAIGPVLIQDGDFYGPVVNLASRLVGVANPGTVLASDEFRVALEDEHAAADAPDAGFEMRGLRTRNLKDIGRIQVWKLSRTGTAPGADRRRNMRWERLEGVLRELDELRDRGEKAVTGGAIPETGTAHPMEDAVAPGGSGRGDARARSSGREPGVRASRPDPSVVEPGGGDALGPELETPLEGSDRPSP